MNKINSVFMALAMMFAVASCNYQEDRGLMPDPDNKTEETNNNNTPEIVDPGEPLSLEISGYVGAISNGDVDANSTRSTSFGDNSDGENGAPIVYKKSSDNYGVFLFRKLGSTNVHKRALKYEVRPVNDLGEEVESSTKAIIKIAAKNEGAVNGKIQLNYGESFADGEWYISGFLGTGTALQNSLDLSGQKFGYKEEVNANIDWNATQTTENNLREVSLPITLKWSKLSTQIENGVPTARASNLKFGVEGTVLSIRARSDIFDDVKVSGLYMVGRYLSFYGSFLMNEVALAKLKDENLKNGDNVPFVYVPDDKKELDYNTNKNWNRLKLTFNNPGKLQAGYESSDLKIVVMPISDVAEGAAERDAHNKTALRAAWYVKDAPGHSLVQNLKMASGDDISENSFEKAKYYNVPVNLGTDLIISEVFSHNPQGYNYSWFELYNGTLDNIDLSDYALGRSQPYGDYYVPFPADYTRGGDDGAALLTPLTMESPSYPFPSEANAQSRIYDGSKLAERAPMLVKKWGGVTNPLTLNGQMPSVDHGWRDGYYWGRERVTVIGLKSYQKRDYHNESFNYVIKRPEARRTLPPGKTIIILSYAYARDRLYPVDISSTISYGWTYGSTGPGWLHGPQMVRAYNNGFCHDMLSYMSYGTSQSSGTNGTGTDNMVTSGDYSAPVLHKSDADGIFLVKRYPDGKKKIIDVFGPMRNSTEGAKFKKQVNIGDRYVATRNDNIVFPNKDSRINEWFVVRYQSSSWGNSPQGNNFANKTSAGTRYYRSSMPSGYGEAYDASDRYVLKQRRWNKK